MVLQVTDCEGGARALHAVRLIDGSNAGPISSKHLTTLKDVYGQDFSKLVLTGPAGADPGANGTWAMSASTAPTTQWRELENVIGMIMQQAVTVHAHAYFTFITFTGGGFNGGALLDSGGKLYVMTAPLTELNCGDPTDSICWRPSALNRRGAGPDYSNCMNPVEYQYLPDAIITSVQYIRTLNHHIYEAQAGNNPIDTARRVVVNALGAVTAAGVLNTIQIRPLGQSIIQAIRNVSWYVRRPWKTAWKAYQRDQRGAVIEAGDELNGNLEKLRKMLDKNDMKIYPYPTLIKGSATERFTILKTIGERLDVVIGKLPEFERGPCLPTSVIGWYDALTTMLNGEKPEAYTPLQWDARLETYRSNLGRFVNVLREYEIGQLHQLNAAERARIIAGGGNLAGTGTGNTPAPPPPIPGPPPPDIQALADVLSKLAVIVGQLDWAKSREMSPERELRFTYVTRDVRVNGKKRTLTMVKVKESSKTPLYVAFEEHNRSPLR